MPSDEVHIPNGQLMIGAFYVLSNARYFMKLSKKHYDNKEFQAAIPFATIALEEAQKGIDLVNRFRRKQDMTKDDWNKMKTHKHKLVHTKEEAAKIMEESSKEEDEDTLKELKENGFSLPDGIDKEKLIEVTRRRAQIHSHFQNLREKCLYTDWNEIDDEWTNFSSLSADRQEALAYMVLEESETDLGFLEFAIEKMVNKLRADKILTAKVPYPPYDECRTVDKFESMKNMNRTRTKAEQIKFNQGILVMKKFIALNSFEDVSFGLFRDSMLKYLKLIQKQPDDKWFPHPIIKAMLIALEGARKEGKDGNYGGVSGDANMTYDGKPFMEVIATVSKKGDIFTMEDISIVGHEDFKFPPDMIEKILRTEIILEKEAGKDITIPTFIEAVSVVGIKAKMIKEGELPDAIEHTKKIAGEGKLSATPEQLEEIKKIKGKEDWDKLSSGTRMLIVTSYGLSKYEGYNFFITPSPAIEKYKARLTIMSALQQKYLDTA